MLKEKQALPIRGLLPIVLTSFLFNFAYTLASPVYPLFVKSLIGNDSYVGYFAAILASLMIIYSFAIQPLLARFKKISILKFGLIGMSFSFVAIYFTNSIYTLLAIELFRTFFLTCAYVPTALLIRDVANKKNLGKTEGFYFTVANLAWMIGPLIGGLIANAYGLREVFLMSAILPLLSFVIINSKKFKEHNRIHKENHSIPVNFLEFLKSRSRALLFMMTLGLLFWWSMIYTFIPLYINDSGFSVETVGIVLFMVVLPLILLEVPAGNLADKFGYKKFFFFGFFLMSALAVLTFFVNSPIIVLTLIVCGSIGAAFVEPLREAYFFEITAAKDENRFYVIHRIAVPIGQLLGPLIFSTFLLFSTYRYLFLFIGTLMLIFSMISLFIKEVK